jgi:uncharacterized protein (DUF427 family)
VVPSLAPTITHRSGASARAGTADHPITIETEAHRLRVKFAGVVVADSTKALVLREANYPPVAYIPRQDANMALLVRTDRKTHCPYKGEASYYSVQANGQLADNAVWTYEHPLADVADIAGHLAFYPDRIDAIERLPA